VVCEFKDGSSDPDGTIHSRSWDFGDGSTSSDTDPTHVYAVANTYTVTLRVTDNGDASRSVSSSVIVASTDNRKPTAAFTAPSCTAGAPCRFDDASTDSDGTVVSRQWEFGSGTSSNEANPSHTFEAAGTYTVTLTVTDDSGASSSIAQDVVVGAESLPAGSSIVLSRAYAVSNGRQYVMLTWTGASGSSVDVYRNGVLRQVTRNDGKYVRFPWSRGAATYVYHICETGTSRCSNTVTADYTARSITLTATSPSQGTRNQATLLWSGASGTQVNIYRNGLLVTRTRNDGRYVSSPLGRGALRSSVYQVCERHTSSCSNRAPVSFR
jgi:serine protease